MRARDRFRLLTSGVVMLLAAVTRGEVDYPIDDAYLATVIGTPRDAQASVPTKVPLEVHSIVRFPARTVPRVFWAKGLRVGASKQEGPAPLAFVVAGTGGNWRDRKVSFLRQALYGAGFHVVALPSPMHDSFVTAASESSTPGWPPADAEDLVATMELARGEIEKDVPVLGTVLVGYSLGATQTAFVAALDAREKRLGLERAYLINPSVRLFSSAVVIDGLFDRAFPDGEESVSALVAQGLREVAAYIHGPARRGHLGSEFVLAGVAEAAAPGEIRGAIAAAFRLMAANLSFSVDLVTAKGRIVPPDNRLTVGTPLAPYFSESLTWSFTRYLDEVLVPYWRAKDGLSRDDLIHGAGLLPLRSWLEQADHVAVTTNEDDWILETEDLAFLRETFKDRITVRANGGHCGNLTYAPLIAEMLRFVSEPWAERR